MLYIYLSIINLKYVPKDKANTCCEKLV